jgi:hypothetical protein
MMQLHSWNAMSGAGHILEYLIVFINTQANPSA